MMQRLTYLILLLSFHSLGQKLDQQISHNEIAIGEPVIVSYSILTKKEDTVLFQPKIDVIEARMVSETGDLSSEKVDFEILQPFIDTFIFDHKEKFWEGQYVVTAWDSGLFVIPPTTIVINDSTYQFETLSLKVNLLPKEEGVDIYDIKEKYADIPEKPFSIVEFISNYWWIFAILIFAVVLYFTFRKRKEVEEEKEPVVMSLKERTLRAIEGLENAKMWEKGKLKQHYIELSFILRSYLTSRYGISLLEKTTYETQLLLTQKGLNKETVDAITTILSQSDMVKFAKSKPDTVAILRISTLAKQIVAETSPLDFDNAE